MLYAWVSTPACLRTKLRIRHQELAHLPAAPAHPDPFLGVQPADGLCGRWPLLSPAGENADLDQILSQLEDVLAHLAAESLTPEQTHHMMYQAMPKLVVMLLKLRCADGEMCDRLNEFFQVVLRTTVEMLRQTNSWELVECTTRVLTDGAAYQLYNRPMMGSRHLPPAGLGELDSASSGDGSASDASLEDGGDLGRDILSNAALDDVSPYYVQNIEYFHQLGGFHACVDRIGRGSCVHLNGVKLLLRPFLKVKDLLSRHAMQSFAKSAHAALMRLVSVLTDEHLKREDRKSMQDVTKTLEALLSSAKLPNAECCLVDFSLALALKCMRAQNLERRLAGLTEVKERISISMRRLEYIETKREQEVAKGSLVQPVPALPNTWTTPNVLVDWLLREQVVELIFGEALHDQVR